MEHFDGGAEAVEDVLSRLPAKEAYLLVGFKCFAVRFGPYPPEKVGEFLTRLMDAHQGPHPFMFTLQCGEVDDPVPLMLELARPDAEPVDPPDSPA